MRKHRKNSLELVSASGAIKRDSGLLCSGVRRAACEWSKGAELGACKAEAKLCRNRPKEVNYTRAGVFFACAVCSVGSVQKV